MGFAAAHVSGGKIVLDSNGEPLIDHGPVLSATDRLLKIHEGRGRLWGIDAPFRVMRRGRCDTRWSVSTSTNSNDRRTVVGPSTPERRLRLNAQSLADMAFDDIANHGDEPVEGRDWMVLEAGTLAG
jgi:hypothetical protein